MSLEDFLSASYALLAEEHQRINPLRDLVSLSEQLAPEPESVPRTAVSTVVEAQNDQSLAQFSSMMKGVQKAR